MGQPEPEARELILRRASEIDVSVEEWSEDLDLESVGREAGISAAALRAAIREREERRRVGRLGPLDLAAGAVVTRHIAAPTEHARALDLVTSLQEHTGEAGRIYQEEDELLWVSETGLRVSLISVDYATCMVAAKEERKFGLGTAVLLMIGGGVWGFVLAGTGIAAAEGISVLVGAGAGLGGWWVCWRAHVRSLRDKLDAVLDHAIPRVFRREEAHD